MEELTKLRKTIDQIDEQIITLLQKRFTIVRQIGTIKKNINLPILDKKRKNELLNIKKSFAHRIGLSKELVEKIFSLIHDEAVKIQRR